MPSEASSNDVPPNDTPAPTATKLKKKRRSRIASTAGSSVASETPRLPESQPDPIPEAEPTIATDSAPPIPVILTTEAPEANTPLESQAPSDVASEVALDVAQLPSLAEETKAEEVNSSRNEAVPAEAQMQEETTAPVTDALQATHRLTEHEEEIRQKEALFWANSSAMAAELDMSQQQLEALKAAYAQKSDEYDKLQAQMSLEIASLQTEIAQQRSDKEREDTENTIIMKMLHAELDKCKQQLTMLQADVEQKDRDDVKNTIMLGLLNSQLEAAKEEAKRSNDIIFDLRKKVELMVSKFEESEQKNLQLEDNQEAERKEYAQKVASLQRELDIQAAKIDQLTALNDKLQVQVDASAQRYSELQKRSEAAEKDLFEKNVILKSEAQHYKTMAAQYSSDLDKTEKERLEKISYQAATIDALKAKLAQLQETHEKSEATAFEKITSCNAELVTLRLKLQGVQDDAAKAAEEASTKLAELQAVIEAQKEREAQDKSISEKKEAEFFKQVTRLTTEVDALQTQLDQLTAAGQKKDRAYIEKTIQLNAERDSLTQRVELLHEEMAQARKQQSSEALQYQTDIALLKQQLAKAEEEHAAEMQEQEDEKAALQATIQNLQGEVGQAKAETVQKVSLGKKRHEDLQLEIVRLKEEIEGHLITIRRLEKSIGENYNFKALAEQNEILKADVESYRNQLRNLNNTLSTMKIEADILDSYKTKALSEQNDTYLRRIQALEREQRAVHPLMSEMIATIQKHGLTSTLKGDIEAYKAMLSQNRVSSPADPRMSSSTPSPAAMGRKKLEPLGGHAAGRYAF